MRRRPAIGLGAAVAVLAAAGGTAVLTWPHTEAPAALPASAASARVEAGGTAPPPAVRTAVAKVRLAGSGALAQRATKKFSMLSVSWDDPADRPAGTVQVRTRSARTGTWTGWQSLVLAGPAADQPVERAGVRGRTEPLWAGPSNGVATRLVGAATGALPAGLRLNLIDPDAPAGTGGTGGMLEPTGPASDAPPAKPVIPSSTAPTADLTGTAKPTPTTPKPTPPGPGKPKPTPETLQPAPQDAPSAARMPAFVSRKDWKADESLVKNPILSASAVKMAWVHHGGFAADYTCAEAPAIIRSIMGNDIEAGYDDIGYNFIVDKCGTIYEGRRGSAATAVIGAHTVGFNNSSVGIALLGDYTERKPSAAGLTAIARVAAARLGAYGFDPLTEAEMTEGVDGMLWPKGSTVRFPRIAGHKDGERNAAGPLTDCPGAMMYPLLGNIRAKAAMPGLALVPAAGGVTPGTTAYVRTSATVNWTVDAAAAGIDRFSILLDGEVVARPAATARTATITVPAGEHTVAVRVLHRSGLSYNSASAKVFGDVTAPTFPTAPSVALRTGTYSTTAVPVTVSFASADNVKVATQAVTAPKAVRLSATAKAWNPTVEPNVAVTYTVTATDTVGNAGQASTSRTAVQLAETAATRTGTWTTRTSTSYLNGKALAATAANAKLAYTFTGRSAALTFTRMPTTGVARVYVDGTKVATVDTKATGTSHRQTLWVRAFSAKKHTVTVVVAGTRGRPTVIADGLTYIR